MNVLYLLLHSILALYCSPLHFLMVSYYTCTLHIGVSQLRMVEICEPCKDVESVMTGSKVRAHLSIHLFIHLSIQSYILY